MKILRVKVDDETWGELQQDAEKQGLTVAEVAARKLAIFPESPFMSSADSEIWEMWHAGMDGGAISRATGQTRQRVSIVRRGFGGAPNKAEPWRGAAA